MVEKERENLQIQIQSYKDYITQSKYEIQVTYYKIYYFIKNYILDSRITDDITSNYSS